MRGRALAAASEARRRLASRMLRLALALCALPLAQDVSAHDARPAYLQIQEIAPGRYDVLWRTPVLSGMRLPVSLRLPDTVRNVTEPAVRELSDSIVERRLIEAHAGTLAGARVEFPGLQATITDVLVRIVLLDGTRSTTLVRASRPWVEVATARGPVGVASAYLAHGVEHILLGIDHLLFVLGLMLMVKDRWMLVKTITAFTVAHSITLAIATLGYAEAPLPPLNAAIALSILFLGPEIVRTWRGETSFTIRHPWVVAFAFGLLHGFGFASGLTAMGLPRAEIPMALLLFNVGVELGQVGFVLLVVLLERSFHLLEVSWAPLVLRLPGYAVGVLGAFWTIQRTVMLVGGSR
jgi:hydrogenase/urease accessory protein HupE